MCVVHYYYCFLLYTRFALYFRYLSTKCCSLCRFEEEIGLPIPEPAPPPLPQVDRPKVIGAHTYNEVQKQLAGISSEATPRPVAPPPIPNGVLTPSAVPPPPPPPPLFVPHQVRGMPVRPKCILFSALDASRPPIDGNMAFSGSFLHGPIPPPPPGPPGPMNASIPPPPPIPGPIPAGMPPGMPFGPIGGGPMGPGPMGPMMPPCPMPPGFTSGPPSFPPQMMPPARFMTSLPPEAPVMPDKPQQPAPAVLSATPMLYVANPQLEIAAHQAENPSVPVQQPEVPTEDLTKKMNKKNKKENEKQANGVFNSDQIPVSGSGQKKKDKKNRKLVRTAGGQTWEDSTLAEWEEDDFRLFCGDLGNDVTDEVLTRAFSKYSSFLKAKVVRDKRTNKTKGFGFVSFKDPQDFIRATKEMNGRYVGSRPIKLRKSTWKHRSLDVVRKKEKEKIALINMFTGR
ncbi:hypothetical protein AAG570_006409 [Ranatra chinensis]|uniref:RNA-binding protein 42 n=1 Tax=Ranatra chinensis TaxID=642074 RepID=A0ABD0YTX1_9HEMI